MATATAEFKVGDKLWFEASRGYGDDRIANVTEVGRKWLTLDIRRGTRWLRIDKATLQIESDGYMAPGKIWVTREECESTRALSAAWYGIEKAIRNKSRPDGVTIDDIREAARLLRIELQDT